MVALKNLSGSQWW